MWEEGRREDEKGGGLYSVDEGGNTGSEPSDTLGFLVVDCSRFWRVQTSKRERA